MPAKGKILNTNMGLGFQRDRKYDTDLDRLGRMETAQSELRKTRELNFQKELKKDKEMKRIYSVRRFSAIRQKEYGMMSGVTEGISTATGSALESAGKVADNGLVKTGAGVAGAIAGSALGPLGMIGGAILGHEGTKAVGKGLKAAGQEMK